MLSQLKLIRNIGQFDSVESPETLSLRRLTLVYAENGRGKTTLSAILRSLGSGEEVHINERRRLAAVNPPHVVLHFSDKTEAVFENGKWNGTRPSLLVYDDWFVENNVCSGLTVGSEHRQNLYSWILGSPGVRLNNELLEHVASIEGHNRTIRTKAESVNESIRGSLSVEEFCELKPCQGIDGMIVDAEKDLDSAQEQEPVRTTPLFEVLELPEIALEMETLLQRDVPALDTKAAIRVAEHCSKIGAKGESWVSEGMSRLSGVDSEQGCPFCGQALTGSLLLQHYRGYFTQGYTELKLAVSDAIRETDRQRTGDSIAALVQSVTLAQDRQRFWSRFCDVPGVELDTSQISRQWNAALDAVKNALLAKQAAPLEPIQLPADAKAAIAEYNKQRDAVATLSRSLEKANATIQDVKRRSALSDVTAIRQELERLRAIKRRHATDNAALCTEYIMAKAAKEEAEKRRDQSKKALSEQRESAFASHHNAINGYLVRFYADFEVGEVKPSDTRWDPTCGYSVQINKEAVPVSGSSPKAGSPSFGSTLSSGDRSTLALAFFLSRLDAEPELDSKIVVIDDPVASLDDHRSLTTAQEIRSIVNRAAQVIVLSHNRPLLCRMWERAIKDRVDCAALQITRGESGSSISTWDVSEHCTTEYDQNHSLLREYICGPYPNNRGVASRIRPLLEGCLRVACPEHFLPESLLGQFISRCSVELARGREILTQEDLRELREITEYANQFHHDTPPAWKPVDINERELVGYIKRALAFVRFRMGPSGGQP